MDEEPAVGHVRNGEVASGVGRGLRERRSAQSNRVFERLIVGFGWVWRSVDRTSGHARRDVYRRDWDEMDSGAGNGMARISGRAADNHRARCAQHPTRELTGVTDYLMCPTGGWHGSKYHFRHQRHGEQ